MNLIRKTFFALFTVFIIAPYALANDQQDLGTLVIEALEKTLIAVNQEVVTDYLSTNSVNHNPEGANGSDPLAGLAKKLQPEAGLQARIRYVIVNGDTLAGHSRYENVGLTPPHGCDVFRVSDGAAVKHWDVIINIPDTDTKTNTSSKFYERNASTIV